MFYYYGRKKRVARFYPSPQYNVIIEPFAGSAAYALHGDNWKRQVILVEKDPKVAEIWRWLIHDATQDDITRLPPLKAGDRSTEFLHIIHAATKMAFHFRCIKVTPVLERNWEISRRIFARDLYKIKHWEIIEGDYTAAPDAEATWFIDPPYKGDAGLGYRWSSKLLNYEQLAAWVMSRRGQIICCEGAEGDYLPFRELVDQKGVAGKVSKERLFHRSDKKTGT